MKRRKNKNASIYSQVEFLLKNYKNYKSGIKNLQKQLDYIMPGITASFEVREGTTGTFSIKSNTEKFAIDRIESRKALTIYEEINTYQLIIDCIDGSMVALKEKEKEFVKLRYFEGHSMASVAEKIGYTERNIYNLRRDVLEQLKISLSGVLKL